MHASAHTFDGTSPTIEKMCHGSFSRNASRTRICEPREMRLSLRTPPDWRGLTQTPPPADDSPSTG